MVSLTPLYQIVASYSTRSLPQNVVCLSRRKKTVHSLCMGWRNFFSSCAVVSVFGSGEEQVLVLHTYALRVQYSCGVVLVFWFWREIVFGVTYIFREQYICTVVSVFWLWREIVFKMRTRFYKKILLGYFFMIRQPMSVFYKT